MYCFAFSLIFIEKWRETEFSLNNGEWKYKQKTEKRDNGAIVGALHAIQ